MWRIKWENGNGMETGVIHGFIGIALCGCGGQAQGLFIVSWHIPKQFPKRSPLFLLFEELLTTC